MIRTTFQGEQIFVFSDIPNFTAGFAADFAAVTDQQQGLTRVETRRPFSLYLRVPSIKFMVTSFDDDLIALQGMLRKITTQRVLLPFYPAIEYWEFRANADFKGGLFIVYKPDWTQYEIYEAGSEPAWPVDGDIVAPALLGHLSSQSNNLRSPGLANWSFEFMESSDPKHALAVSPDFNAPLVGPKPDGYASPPAYLPLIPDWSGVAEDLVVAVKRDQIGFERKTEQTFYPHDVYRVNTSSYTLDGDQSAELVSFFLDVAGMGQPFWTAGSLIVGKLDSPALAADTTLTLSDASGLLAEDYVYLAPSTGRIISIAGNVLTLSDPIGQDYPEGWPVYALNLARLDQPKISISWISPELAKAKLKWVEVRVEKHVPVSETVGSTMGQLPLRIALLQFSRDYGNGTVTNYYYTSSELDIDYNGHTWLSKPFEIGDITSSLNLENDSANLGSFIFDGNPLADEVAMISEAPLSVTITFADYDTGEISNPQQVFSGDCTAVSRNGSVLSATCKFGSSIFETSLPRFVRGPMCNHLGGSNNDGSFLISAGCTLLKADWKFTGLVANAISNSFPFTLKLSSLTGIGAQAITALSTPAIFLQWFSNGWVEWGIGSNIQRRLIIGSTVPVAGAISLTLHRYFTALPTLGDIITIYPGCDGLFETCKAYNSVSNPTGKFNNLLNFGGEPFTPIANPSTSGLPTLNLHGGKK